MSNVVQLETSRHETYKGVMITQVYDRERNEWMYGYNLSDILRKPFPTIIFGFASTPDEGFAKARARIDNMMAHYNLPERKNDNGDDGDDAA